MSFICRRHKGKSASDPDSLFSSLEREILNVDQWLSINKMTVNTKII